MNRSGVDFLDAAEQGLSALNDIFFGSKKQKARGRRKARKAAREVKSGIERVAEAIVPEKRRAARRRRSGLRSLLLMGLGIGAGVGLSRLLREQNRMDFLGKTVVITGGSRGLGLVMARQFAAEGANLALLARNQAELDRAKQELDPYGVRVLPIICDIGQRDQVEKSIQWVKDELGRVDVLINLAGIVQVGPIEHINLEDFQRSMDVHFWGHLYTTFAVAPLMRQQGGGRIINVSSVGGQVAVPHMAPYSASKFALTGLSDALRAEMAKDGILISTICPGLMRTGSPPNGEFRGQHEKEYAWFSIGDATPLTSVSAEKAAAEIIDAARYGISKRTLTWQARLLVIAETLFPNLVAAIMKAVNRLVLPGPTGPEGDQTRMGYESYSSLSPSWITAMSDEAVTRNNEAPSALVPKEIQE